MIDFLNPFQYAGLISFLASLSATNLLIVSHLNDAPNESRKLHTQSTPTAGGLSIVWGVAIASFYIQIDTEYVENKQFILIVGMAAFYGAIGLIDDLMGLGSKRRLALLLVISFAIGLSEYGVRALPIWGSVSLNLLPIIGAAGTMCWLVLVINCVNFMDGANGLSIGSSALALLFMSALALMHKDIGSATMGLIGASACAGFLTYNVTKGAIFAGDVGSYFVGGFVGLMGLCLIKSGVSPFLIAICILPLLSDAIFTIFHRIRLKQNIFTPHNQHIYQRLIASGKSHLSIAGLWWWQTIVCGIFALLIDKYLPFNTSIFLGVLVLIYGVAFWQMRRRLS